MKIVVAGAGYVGLANALILAKNNEVILIDPNEEKVRLINQGMSPIEDISILEYLQHEKIHLRVTIDEIEA